MSVHELAEMISQVVGFEGEIKYDVSKPDGSPRKLMNIDILESFFEGQKQEISLYEGIKQTYKWFIDNKKKSQGS